MMEKWIKLMKFKRENLPSIFPACAFIYLSIEGRSRGYSTFQVPSSEHFYKLFKLICVKNVCLQTNKIGRFHQKLEKND